MPITLISVPSKIKIGPLSSTLKGLGFGDILHSSSFLLGKKPQVSVSSPNTTELCQATVISLSLSSLLLSCLRYLNDADSGSILNKIRKNLYFWRCTKTPEIFDRCLTLFSTTTIPTKKAWPAAISWCRVVLV